MNDLPPEPDQARLAAWRAFLTAHAAVIARIERELAAEHQIPLVWYDVLTALSDAPGGRLRLHELASAVVLSRSGLTRLVDRLETAGLLRREPCPSDRRGAFAVLTPDGESTLHRTWPRYARGIVAHFAAHLSDDEARALTVSLERIAAQARTDSPP